jgi:hypothetical protein
MIKQKDLGLIKIIMKTCT